MSKELREALQSALSALDYIERAHPEATGKWQRIDAIRAATAALASPAGEDGERLNWLISRPLVQLEQRMGWRVYNSGDGTYWTREYATPRGAIDAARTREGFADFIRSSGAEKDAAMLEVADAAIAKQSRTREGGEGECNRDCDCTGECKAGIEARSGGGRGY